MEPVNRRSFLTKGAAGAVAVGGAVGGGLAFASWDDGGAPAMSAQELDEIDGPVLVQIRDASAGEVELLVGEREVTFTDRALVARVLRAAS